MLEASDKLYKSEAGIYVFPGDTPEVSYTFLLPPNCLNIFLIIRDLPVQFMPSLVFKIREVMMRSTATNLEVRYIRRGTSEASYTQFVL